MRPNEPLQGEDRSPALEISDVSVKTVHGGRDGLRGWASVTIGGAYRLNQIAIREGSDGLYVTFPAKRLSSGERRYHHFPVNRAAAEAVKSAILDHLSKLASAAPAASASEERD